MIRKRRLRRKLTMSDSELSRCLSRLGTAPDGHWSATAINLTTGERASWQGDVPMNPASAAKLALLVMVADHLDDSPESNTSNRIPISSGHQVAGTGVLRFLEPGLQPTLRDLAVLMSILSDNLATNLIIDHLGGKEPINTWLRARGIDGLTFHGPIDFSNDSGFATATTDALVAVASLLDHNGGLSPRAVTWAREVLFRQQHTLFLSRHLPHSYHAADFGFELPLRAYTKHGAFPGVVADVGLFETATATWAIAAIGNDTNDLIGSPDEAGPIRLAEIGQAAYTTWTT